MRTLLLIAGVAIVFLVAWYGPNKLYQHHQELPENKTSTTSTTIEASGNVLGVGIGTTLEEAHNKLDVLRDPASTGLQDKEGNEGNEGEKAYWRLVGTEYSWIMLWSNKEGRVVQVSAAVRPEKPKPFKEVGDLSKAAINDENAAKWNVQRPDNLSYRLVARGPNHRATNIYLIATTLERE